MRILIVEDDAILADGVARTIQQMGFRPTVTSDGTRASELLSEEAFDLVLLDIGLPGVDGLTLLRRLRDGDSRTPVMLLTARDGIDDRIRGLDLGADDYLVKPVILSELAARVRARLRRVQLETSDELLHGPLRMDTRTRRAWLGAEVLALTSREWEVLEYLLRRPERVVSKEQIQSLVIGRDEPNYNAVEVYVSRLRAKLEPAGVRIRTVRGFGYMLDDYRPE